MKRINANKIFIISILVILQMASFCFAKEMIKAGDAFYLIDDDSNICKNELYETETAVRYFGEDGKMIVGWWKKPNTESTYFFNNVKSETYGAMVFGVHVIDGYLRVFGKNGVLITSKRHYVGDDGKSYRIDINGDVYTSDNVLLRDTSEARSEYYTDERYYTNINLNNKTLAESKNISLWSIIKPDTAKGELDIVKDEAGKKLVQDKINSMINEKKIIISDKLK